MAVGPGSVARGGSHIFEGKNGPRLVITSLVSLALIASALVFVNNVIYSQLRSALASSSSGLGMDADLFLALLLLFALALGLMNERLLWVSLIGAWLMLIPSLLYFSALDWMKALNLAVDFHDMANRLPDFVVFLNGALLVAVGLMLRSHMHTDAVRVNLLHRGASPEQVRSAVGRNVSFLYRIIGLSTFGCLIVASLVILIAPAFSALFSRSELAYLVVSLVAGVLLLAALGIFIWREGRKASKGMAMDKDDGKAIHPP